MSTNLDAFEQGNEINTEAPNYRPVNYTLQSYANEWNYKTAAIKTAYEKLCPGAFPGLMSPILVILDRLKNNYTAEALFQLGFSLKNLAEDLSFYNISLLMHPLLGAISKN